MIFAGLRDANDPGLDARLTVVSHGIDAHLPRRRDPRPVLWFAICWRCFWTALGVASLLRIIVG